MSNRSFLNSKSHQENRWSQYLSVRTGLGIGLLGAFALAVGLRKYPYRRKEIPENISPAVFATKVLDTPSGKIVYHTAGHGTPLLFLHDFFPGASSFEWSKVYPAFGIGYQVLAPDLIGFGESQRPRPAISVEAHLQAMEIFLLSTSKEPLKIIASGWSANLALLIAAYYPHCCTELFLWRPLLAFRKIFSSFLYHHFSLFPLIARFLYRNYWNPEEMIAQWLENSGFTRSDPSFGEALAIFSSMAQQYGAEHAFLAQSSPEFWRKMIVNMPSIKAPVTLLSNEGNEHQTNEMIIHLRSHISRFSIAKIATKSLFAPLTHPQLMISSLEHELKNRVDESPSSL